MIPQIFASRLAQALERKRKYMSFSAIAKKSGFSETYIRRVIKGQRPNPSLMFILVMAETLGESVDFLLGLNSTGESNANQPQ